MHEDARHAGSAAACAYSAVAVAFAWRIYMPRRVQQHVCTQQQPGHGERGVQRRPRVVDEQRGVQRIPMATETKLVFFWGGWFFGHARLCGPFVNQKKTRVRIWVVCSLTGVVGAAQVMGVEYDPCSAKASPMQTTAAATRSTAVCVTVVMYTCIILAPFNSVSS